MSFTGKFAKFSRTPARTADGDGLTASAARLKADEGLNPGLNAGPSPELNVMKSDKPEWNAMKLGEMDGMGELDGMGEMNEAELNQIGEALRDFRLSVHAWSAHAHSAQVQTAHAQNVRAQQVLGWNEAAVGQPRRTLTRSLRPRVRRLALG
jgi:hypothetical protein